MHFEPGALISVNFLLCEGITEENGAVSLSRIADIFIVNTIEPSVIQLVPVQIAVLLKFDSDYPRDHSAKILIEYPDGTMGEVISDIQMPVTAARAAVQRSDFGNSSSTHSFSVLTGVRFGVEQLGRHYLILLVDGKQVACEPLTFALQSWMTGGK